MQITAYASGSSGNLYKIDNGRTQLLIECGLPYKKIQQALNYKICDIDGVLVSHAHKDHSKSVKDLLAIGKDAYMSAGTAIDLNISSNPALHILQAKQPFKIGSYVVTPFDTEHDASEPLGFVIADDKDKLMFATDTYYLRYKFAALTQIMIECNHSYSILDQNVASGVLKEFLAKRLVKSHFSLDNVKKWLMDNDLSRVKEIWLLHLSKANADAKLFKKEIAALTGLPVYIAGK